MVQIISFLCQSLSQSSFPRSAREGTCLRPVHHDTERAVGAGPCLLVDLSPVPCSLFPQTLRSEAQGHTDGRRPRARPPAALHCRPWAPVLIRVWARLRFLGTHLSTDALEETSFLPFVYILKCSLFYWKSGLPCFSSTSFMLSFYIFLTQPQTQRNPSFLL